MSNIWNLPRSSKVRLYRHISPTAAPRRALLTHSLEYWHNGRAGLRALTRQRIDNGDWLLRELEEMGVEPDFSGSIFDNTIGAHTQHTHDPIDTCTVFAYLLTIVPNVTEIKACFHNQEGKSRRFTSLSVQAILLLSCLLVRIWHIPVRCRRTQVSAPCRMLFANDGVCRMAQKRTENLCSSGCKARSHCSSASTPDKTRLR